MSQRVAQLHAEGQRAFLSGETAKAIVKFEAAAQMADQDGAPSVAASLRAGAAEFRRDLEG
jgi:hypothetical protein